MALALSLLLFPTCEKAFSSQIMLLHTREHVWSEFQAMEPPCTQSGPREHWAADGLHCYKHKYGLGGKKAHVAFQRKPILGIVFFTEWSYFARRQLPDSCLAQIEITIRPSWSLLAMFGLFPLVKRMNFQAKSGFCTHENTFAVRFKQQKPPVHKQGHWSTGQPRDCITQCMKEA